MICRWWVGSSISFGPVGRLNKRLFGSVLFPFFFIFRLDIVDLILANPAPLLACGHAPAFRRSPPPTTRADEKDRSDVSSEDSVTRDGDPNCISPMGKQDLVRAECRQANR